MDSIITFFENYGIGLTLIALIGIIILGVLKYCNLFTAIDKDKRHIVYLAISIGLTLIGTAVYLLIEKQFDINYFLALSVAIYTLNQTFYNIFKVTKLKDLFCEILDFIKKLIKGAKENDC